jgi:uncharacterized protein with NAD-binding domain and iron-sulfur cluster
VRQLFPSARGLELEWHSIVKIGQSLYREAPGMDVYRPDQATPVKNFFLAGSYTKQARGLGGRGGHREGGRGRFLGKGAGGRAGFFEAAAGPDCCSCVLSAWPLYVPGAGSWWAGRRVRRLAQLAAPGAAGGAERALLADRHPSHSLQDYIDSMEGATLSGRQCANVILAAAPALQKAAAAVV